MVEFKPRAKFQLRTQSKKKIHAKNLVFFIGQIFVLLYPTYNMKKEQKFPQGTHIFAGFSFDFSASTLFGSIIPLLKALNQGIRTSS